jgi:hypothetical protein
MHPGLPYLNECSGSLTDLPLADPLLPACTGSFSNPIPRILRCTSPIMHMQTPPVDRLIHTRVLSTIAGAHCATLLH